MTEPTFNVRLGTCFALYAYDIAFSIDLDWCRKKFAISPGAQVPENRRSPKRFAYDPPPLSINRAIAPIRLGKHTVNPEVELLLYDFGAVSVNFTIPFSGGFDDMACLTRDLLENPGLLKESRRQIESLLASIGGGVMKPNISDVVEDYFILRVDEFDSPVPPSAIPSRWAGDLARVLRAEETVLSDQEAADAMICRISYGNNDVIVVDWNAALVVDRDADDVYSVLEFANLELLEMRFLDRKLDQWLDEAHDITSGSRTRFRQMVASRTSMRRISEMQMDGAILFERVSNAPKLLGDQYLARLYRLASKRFHLGEWNASILRKLDVIEGIYEKIAARAANRRLEMLDWIIIILIAFEIVMAFLPNLR